VKRSTFILIFLSIVCLASPLQVIASGASPGSDSGVYAAGAQQPDTPTVLENPAGVVVHGAHLPPINNYGQELFAFSDLVGKDLGILHWYMGWYFAPSSFAWLPQQLEAQVPAPRRPHLMISWVPVGRNCRTTPPNLADTTGENTSLFDIRDGYCDSYIRLVAQELKDFPFTFLIRFAHEMNISDQPYWVGHYNSGPELYIAAYRRIHDVFEDEGVTNVQWVWAPNFASYPDEEWNSLFNYYPGDQYVDWVGLSAYNYAGWKNWPWWTLTDLFDSDRWEHVLPAVSCRYAKPILLETATVEGTRSGDGTKAAWILDAYEQLDRYPFVKAIIWYNDFDFSNPDEADFRVAGGSSDDPNPWHAGYAYPLPQGDGKWTNAYRTAIARDRYVSYVPPLQDITPPATWCGGEPTIALPSGILATPGGTASFGIVAVGLPADAHLYMQGLPPEVTGQLSQDYLLSPWDSAQVQLQFSPSSPVGSQNLVLTVDCGSVQYTRTVTFKIIDEIHRALLPAISRSY
jgi:hypothetical protein